MVPCEPKRPLGIDPQNETTTKKSVEKKTAFSQVLTSARNPAGAVVRDLGGFFFFGGREGWSCFFFPDRVARGQVKFVVSTGPAFVASFTATSSLFQTATLLPQLDGVALLAAVRQAEHAQHG